MRLKRNATKQRKTKGRGRERIKKRSTVTEYAAVTELDLREFKKKNFVCANRAVHQHNHSFNRLRCQPFIAVTMARLAMALNWAPQDTFVLESSLLHCQPLYTADLRPKCIWQTSPWQCQQWPHMSCTNKFREGHRRAEESQLFCLGWEYDSETSGENQPILPGSCGCMVRRKLWLNLHWTVIRSS